MFNSATFAMQDFEEQVFRGMDSEKAARARAKLQECEEQVSGLTALHACALRTTQSRVDSALCCTTHASRSYQFPIIADSGYSKVEVGKGSAFSGTR